MKRIKLKKRKNKLRFKRNLVLTSTLVLLFVVGIGYSALSTNLSILGNITVKKHYGKTLYEVLEKEANIGTYAREYTGEHHDSFTEEPTKKIYHWYAPNTTSGNELANEILDKFNVIYGKFCWQMFRTTDTGGVKLMYFGESENGKCLSNRPNHVGYSDYSSKTLNTSYYYGTNYTYDSSTGLFSLAGTKTTGSIPIGTYTCTSTDSNAGCSTLYLVDRLSSGSSYYVFYIVSNAHYAAIGKTPYNYRYSSPADLGFMYNERVTQTTFITAPLTIIYESESLKTTYYYGDLQIINGQYKLANPFKISSSSEYSSLLGKYTLKSTSETATTSTAYYISLSSAYYLYYIPLSSGNDLNFYDDIYTYGDTYTDNGNGTYTINNPSTTKKSIWPSNISNVEKKYVCINATNNTCSELLYIHQTYTTGYESFSTNRLYKYSSSFTYNNGNYTLSNDGAKYYWNLESVSGASDTYTCYNSNGVCTSLYYPYYSEKNYKKYYCMLLSNGESIVDLNNRMFYEDNVNTYNSVIKSAIEYWYEKELLGTNEARGIEDVVYCSNRSLYSEYNFGEAGHKCSHLTDRFSVSNNKAKLKYPVGVITNAEKEYFGNSIIRAVDIDYYTMSPDYFRGNYYARPYAVSSAGGIYSGTVDDAHGVRPVISLKPGTEYVSGTGSREDPYVVSN